jgi:hypothetical protein
MSIEKLKKEIADKQAQLDKLISQKENKVPIKSLDDYTIEEKEAFFNKMHAIALATLNEKIANGREDDSDDEHYLWEEVMGILAYNKNAFWNYWNKLT